MIVWCFAQQRARGGPLDNKLAEDGHYSDREEHFKQALAGRPPASPNAHHAKRDLLQCQKRLFIVSKDTSQRPPRSRACVPRNGTYHSVKK